MDVGVHSILLYSLEYPRVRFLGEPATLTHQGIETNYRGQ